MRRPLKMTVSYIREMNLCNLNEVTTHKYFPNPFPQDNKNSRDTIAGVHNPLTI